MIRLEPKTTQSTLGSAQRTRGKTHFRLLRLVFPKSVDLPPNLFPFTPNEPRRHTHPRDRPGNQPPGPPCFSPQMGLGPSQEKQGNKPGLTAKVTEPQGNMQNVSAKGPKHSAHTSTNSYQWTEDPSSVPSLSHSRAQTQPQPGDRERSSPNISRSHPLCLRGCAPSTLPWLQDPPHQAHATFTSGPVHPSGKRQNTHHLMLPKCPCLSLIPKTEKQSHLSKHTPPTAKSP